MKSVINYLKLSKELSYALRHKPEEYGLTPDELGWVSVSDLIEALHKRKWSVNVGTGTLGGAGIEVDWNVLKHIVDTDEKGRYEIERNRIRAVYGHSFLKPIEQTEEEPPEFLYHGTGEKTRSAILKEGIKKMNRQYVHLSEDTETAISVGRRHDKQAVLFEVSARHAFIEGIKFYKAPNGIWLSQDIPPKFIKAINIPSQETLINFLLGY